MKIIKSSILMKSKPNETSLLETECLFGETVKILEEFSEWAYCRLVTDNYCGWIKKKGLGKLNHPTHRVFVKRSFVYKYKNPKSNCIFHLPMGARLSIDKIELDWAKTVILINNKKQIGYVPSKHIVKLDHNINDWVAKAQELENTPYKWGGRDTVGIDCSALLQLSYQTYGQSIPRNTSQQIKLEKKSIDSINNLKRGYVVFWEGHVGIMIDSKNCIHANSFHMKTTTEPLSQIINRSGKINNIKKIMDFN